MTIFLSMPGSLDSWQAIQIVSFNQKDPGMTHQSVGVFRVIFSPTLVGTLLGMVPLTWGLVPKTDWPLFLRDATESTFWPGLSGLVPMLNDCVLSTTLSSLETMYFLASTSSLHNEGWGQHTWVFPIFWIEGSNNHWGLCATLVHQQAEHTVTPVSDKLCLVCLSGTWSHENRSSFYSWSAVFMKVPSDPFLSLLSLIRVRHTILRTMFWDKVRQMSCIVPLSTSRDVKVNGVFPHALVFLVFMGNDLGLW